MSTLYPETLYLLLLLLSLQMFLCYLEMLVKCTWTLYTAVVRVWSSSVCILCVHCTIYYLQGVPLQIIIEFTCNAQSINDHTYVRTYSMYVYVYSTNISVDILFETYTYIWISLWAVHVCLSHLLPHCTAHLVYKPELDWCWVHWLPTPSLCRAGLVLQNRIHLLLLVQFLH